MLATHELGVEGEVVTVKEPAKLVTPKEPDPLPQAGSDLLAVFGVAVGNSRALRRHARRHPASLLMPFVPAV